MKKLNKKILNDIIKEVLLEAQTQDAEAAPTGALASGAGVTGSTFKRFAKLAGEEQAQLTADKEVTANENKVVKKYLEILQLSAEVADIESGAFYQLLNATYTRLKKLIEIEQKKSTDTQAPTGD